MGSGDWDLGLGAGILALRLGFFTLKLGSEPQDLNLGLEARI